jgi:CheY-like chemotaxis protein
VRQPSDDEHELLARARPERAARSASASTAILLADDDDSFRQPLREVLEEEGYAVLETANGVETIELLASGADGDGPIPDVIVLDVNMPGCSGLGVLSVMQRFALRAPKVILVTGFVDPSIRAFATRLGAIHVMRKPVDLDLLLAEVLAAAKSCAAHDRH